MQRLTIPYVKQLRTGVPCNTAINRLSEYEDIGYTPEELKLCFNTPNLVIKSTMKWYIRFILLTENRLNSVKETYTGTVAQWITYRLLPDK